MAHVVPLGLMLLLFAGSAPGDEFEPVTKEQLRSKVPHFFSYDYPFAPEPGERIWLRVDDDTWIERYPSGSENRFDVLGRATVEGVEGIVVERSEDRGIRVFIADKGQERMEIRFREPGKEKGWSLLGEMKKVD